MVRLRDSRRTSLSAPQQPWNPQPESIARNRYHRLRALHWSAPCLSFAATGWSQADKLDLTSSARMVFAFVFGRSYSTAPFSTLYLFGRGQDIGFEKAIDNSPRRRHHVRFWGMPFAR